MNDYHYGGLLAAAVAQWVRAFSRKWNVGCANPSRDRPKSFKQVVMFGIRLLGCLSCCKISLVPPSRKETQLEIYRHTNELQNQLPFNRHLQISSSASFGLFAVRCGGCTPTTVFPIGVTPSLTVPHHRTARGTGPVPHHGAVTSLSLT